MNPGGCSATIHGVSCPNLAPTALGSTVMLNSYLATGTRTMTSFLNPALSSVMLAIALFVGLLVCLDIGYRLGHRAAEKYSEAAHEGIGVIEAAIFALLGLLLGFSFSGGTSRLDARRQLIVQEANAIGTAYLRLDQLPASEQPEMRQLFREYLDTRLRVYEKLHDQIAAEQQQARAEQLQREIWSKAVAGSRGDPTQNATRLLLPALNEMIDVTTARTIALHTHLPRLVFVMLVFVALLSALLAGYAMAKRKQRSALHMLLYAGVIALTIYVILDLDDPRAGLIHLDKADNALIQLRDSIHQ